MPRTPMHLILAAALFAAGPTLAQKTPVFAMITDVHGAVTLSRGGAMLTPTVAGEIAPVMKIEVKDGARLVMLELSSGDELQLAGPATADVGPNGITAAGGKLIRKSTRVGPVKVREGGLAQAAVVMRAALPIQRLPLLTLHGTATMEANPVFQWQAVEGVGPYRFELTDANGKVLLEVRTEATQLKLPEGIALAEGGAYTWEVSARRADGARFSNFGDFTVAPKALRERAKELRPPEGASASEWATYALWLDGQGLADESRATWKRLAKDRPDDKMLKALAGS